MYRKTNKKIFLRENFYKISNFFSNHIDKPIQREEIREKFNFS